MAKIHINDIADNLADEMGLSRSAAKTYTEFVFKRLREYVENGDEVNISMFGKFKMTITAPRKGLNVRTKERIDISAKHKITFEMSRKLQQIYNEAGRPKAGGGEED